VTNLIDVDCYWNKCTSMFLINDRDGNQNSVSMFFFFCDSYSVMLNSTLQPSSDNIYTANDED